MNILVKAATILDSQSDFHLKKVDILIENGTISNIGENIEDVDAVTVEKPNLHVSKGWFDSSVSFGEPGYEERETIDNGLYTAALSGFTDVALNANTHPVLDSSPDISFVLGQAARHATRLYPIGALTVGSKSEDLAELFDMKSAGAVAFGDYQVPVSNPNLLKVALQYAQNFDGLVLSFPMETKIAGKGLVNEHHTSTRIGLKGIPTLAESLYVARDLSILEYTAGKLHIPTISTAKSVALIREAKTKGLDVTCSVAIHNLYFTDEVLQEFDTNYKVLPPLRTEADVKALVSGLKDGTIDMVTSDHNPLDIERKKLAFDQADYGTIGLESAFGALRTLFDAETCADVLSKGKKRFGIEETSISVGEKACIALFDPDSPYIFTESRILSSSKNSAFLNEGLTGTVYGTINDQTLSMH